MYILKEKEDYVKEFVAPDAEPMFYSHFDTDYEEGNLEGLELTEDSNKAGTFSCKCDAQQFMNKNGCSMCFDIVEA